MILSSKYYVSEKYHLFSVLVACKFSCKVVAIDILPGHIFLQKKNVCQ